MMTFDPGPLFEARADEGATLVLVRDLQHPPEKVWAALTEPEQLAAWSPYTADRDLGTPGEATLTMIDGETETKLPAVVRRAEPPVLLEYSWGADLLRWELVGTGTGTGTRLTLRHTVEDRDWLAKAAAGWHLCLVVAGHLLDGRPIAPIRGQDARNYGWDELRDAYAARLSAPIKE
jgi:uncharacterized protein YndB with AHSA1/START domain